MTAPARRFSNRPCVFREAFIRDQIDPRVKEIWAKRPGGKAPFGRLRKAFQEEHCSKINPYTGGECPYRVEECGMAFLSAVQNVTLPWISDPAAYFVKLVASTGIDRADNKPLMRERHREQEPSHGGGRGTGTPAGRPPDMGGVDRAPAGHVVQTLLGDEDGLRRAAHRPESIGSLLGSLDLGPREGRAPNGAEGNK